MSRVPWLNRKKAKSTVTRRLNFFRSNNPSAYPFPPPNLRCVKYTRGTNDEDKFNEAEYKSEARFNSKREKKLLLTGGLQIFGAYPGESQRTTRKKWTEDQPFEFTINKKLGSGSFGNVFSATDKRGRVVAIKMLSKKNYDQIPNGAELIAREVNIHRRLRHKNVVRLLAIFQDHQNVNIVLEYAYNGCLFDLLRKNKGNGACFREDVVKDWIYQIAKALKYLHKKKIVHADIKPENILMNRKNAPLLSDFGFSMKLDPQKVWKGSDNFEGYEIGVQRVGTEVFRAPEIWRNEVCDTQVDMWALGVVMYELLFGRVPFQNGECLTKALEIYEHLSTSAENLLKRLLITDPKRRITASEVLTHPWMKV